MMNAELFRCTKRLIFTFIILHSSFCIGSPPRPLADEPLVDLHEVDPTIVIDLRYAGERNIFGKPIYVSGARCLVREGVAQRLRYAQYILRQQGFGLKIWDAY